MKTAQDQAPEKLTSDNEMLESEPQPGIKHQDVYIKVYVPRKTI